MRKLNKILILDDSNAVNSLNRHLLESMGVCNEVVSYTSPFDALKYLESDFINANYDLLPEMIFLDIEMPVMNGFEFLRKYGEFDKVKDLENKPFIVIISDHLLKNENFADLKRYSHLGVRSHYMKPIEKEDILDVLEEYSEIY